MKKTRKKLVLRTETLKALATNQLALAIGGVDSGSCPIAFDTGDMACGAPHLAIVSAACR
jgi:hypothetical protein